MDTRTFYGRKEHDRAVRVIPADSQDSELEESDNEDSEIEESQEVWIPESGTRMFWNKACRVSQVADTMTLNRWEAIKKSLHFSNNEERQEENDDPLHKIRPLVTHLTSKLRNLHRESVQPPELADVGASGNVVLRLAQPIPKQENYKLIFENWFTSVPLVLTLAQPGIHCTGTVRGNRLPGVNLMCDAELKRRGSFEQKIEKIGETTLHVVKWYDNRSVTLLSDYTGAQPVTEVDRWDRKRKMITKVPCPAVVKEYNKNMGGVDLLDSLIALYRNKIRSKKWCSTSWI
ncbi:hypothetical protein SKAU_G00275690 [Synaphobranchus kaupii]|uniref:PiggyBac transposable element-derived protein domain-containing protein n=1 Tax=Synaphobranchus kaupii TaxID=118154 RepID=A0A9Q1F1D9_SYNKA|nr:hypothetical protein SKAU_G00275690 [Synaphobranchus kaupii]